MKILSPAPIYLTNMHTSNKKREDKLSHREFEEWCDRYFDFDYDYDCDQYCPCCARPSTEYDDFFMMVAELVAETIVREQHLNDDVRRMLVEERMEAYTAWPRRQVKLNDKVKEDVAYIWPFIKDTATGRELFSKIFGQNE